MVVTWRQMKLDVYCAGRKQSILEPDDAWYSYIDVVTIVLSHRSNEESFDDAFESVCTKLIREKEKQLF